MKKLLWKESMDSKCKRCQMGGMQTHQQNWNHCTVRSTNRSIEMMYPGVTTKDKYNRYTTSSIRSSKLENKLSTELKDRRFKFEPELFSTKVSVKEYSRIQEKNSVQL